MHRLTMNPVFVVVFALSLLTSSRLAGRSARPPVAIDNEQPFTPTGALDLSEGTRRSGLEPVDLTFEEATRDLDGAFADLRPAFRQEAFFRVRRGVRSPDLPRMLAAVASRKGVEGIDLAAYLAGRWCETDPHAAIAYVQSLPPSSIRDEALRTVLAEWTVAASDECVKWLNALPPGKEKELHYDIVVDTLARENPRRALTLIASSPDISSKPQAYATVLRRWAQREAPLAANAAMELVGLPAEVWGDLAWWWAGSDAEAAANWADRLPSAPDRVPALRRVLSAWADHDPQRAAAFAWNREAAGSQPRLLQPVISQWAAVDPLAATQWVSSLPAGPLRDQVLSVSLLVWAEADPQSALRYALDQGFGRTHPEALAHIEVTWVEADPKAAIAWISTQPSLKQRDFAGALFLAPTNGRSRGFLAAYIGQTVPQPAFINDDPEQAAELVKSLDPGMQHDLTFCLAKAWGHDDLAGALGWAKGLSDGGAKAEALSGLLSEYIGNDPQAAANQVLAVASSSSDAQLMLLRVAGEWAATEPQAAITWLEKVQADHTLEKLDNPAARTQILPSLMSGWCRFSPFDAASYAANLSEGPDQQTAVLAVARGWAASDPSAVASWVGSFPEGRLRDDAISAVAGAWAPQDGPAAVAWIQSLGDGGTLHQSLISALEAWQFRDPEVAAAWIQSSDLPGNVKSRFLH